MTNHWGYLSYLTRWGKKEREKDHTFCCLLNRIIFKQGICVSTIVTATWGMFQSHDSATQSGLHRDSSLKKYKLSSFSHSHVVPNLYDFLLWNTKEDISKSQLLYGKVLQRSKLSPLASFLWTQLINLWRINSAKVILITSFFINRSSLINYFSNWCFHQFKWSAAISVMSHMKSRSVPHTIDVKVMAHQR